MNNIALIITTTIAMVSSAILFMGYVDNVNTDFSNYEEMQSSEIIERGWVPAYLPKTSVNISEHHNIDTNRVTVSFEYDVNEDLEVETLCTKIGSSYKGDKYVCPPYVGATSVITLRNDGTGFYKSEYDGLIH